MPGWDRMWSSPGGAGEMRNERAQLTPLVSDVTGNEGFHVQGSLFPKQARRSSHLLGELQQHTNRIQPQPHVAGSSYMNIPAQDSKNRTADISGSCTCTQEIVYTTLPQVPAADLWSLALNSLAAPSTSHLEQPLKPNSCRWNCAWVSSVQGRGPNISSVLQTSRASC